MGMGHVHVFPGREHASIDFFCAVCWGPGEVGCPLPAWNHCRELLEE